VREFRPNEHRKNIPHFILPGDKIIDQLFKSVISSIRLPNYRGICFSRGRIFRVVIDFRGNVYEQSKVCLLLGVSIHREIFFENVLPDHAGEWRVMTRPGPFSNSLLPSALF